MIGHAKSLIGCERRDVLDRNCYTICSVGNPRRETNKNQGGHGEHRSTAGHGFDAGYGVVCDADGRVMADLIVRGACTLRPGVKGLSENIRVRSIVGRFLEHHRIYYFRNGGADDVYLASADWMGRNLFRRIEVAWPVLDGKLKRRVLDEGLRPYLDDTVDAWTLQSDGTYRPPKAVGRGDHGGFSAQRALLVELAASVGES